MRLFDYIKGVSYERGNSLAVVFLSSLGLLKEIVDIGDTFLGYSWKIRARVTP